MENKTSYTPQDAKNGVDKKYGFEKAFIYHWNEVAELYKEKATEELRKENERLSKITHEVNVMYSEVERLTQSNKQMKEIFNLIKPQLIKHGFKNTVEEIDILINKE